MTTDWMSMNWDLDGGGHEGWAAPVLDDGREAHGSSGHGQFVRGITGKYPVDPYMDDVEIVPDVHVAGWGAPANAAGEDGPGPGCSPSSTKTSPSSKPLWRPRTMPMPLRRRVLDR
ncbi:hypothetical protein [Arthrobacter methylotrophus]|uniref:hypothetical protein n=1 Tax=Arthrobacter methylotrophus TaxID=121291 RepID=UPI0031F137A6